MNPRRVLLLSPASCRGRRAQVLMNPRAGFELAVRLREGAVTLGEAFRFLSGLYFRGKLAYARRFASSSDIFVITTNHGLVSPDVPVTREELCAFASGEIDAADLRYREPLERDVRAMCETPGPRPSAVLLGSVATGKYVEPLLEAFGSALLFPADFVGRGDLSRGGLLLRHAAAGSELEYIPVEGALRRGRRPPRLEPKRWPAEL